MFVSSSLLAHVCRGIRFLALLLPLLPLAVSFSFLSLWFFSRLGIYFSLLYLFFPRLVQWTSPDSPAHAYSRFFLCWCLCDEVFSFVLLSRFGLVIVFACVCNVRHWSRTLPGSLSSSGAHQKQQPIRSRDLKQRSLAVCVFGAFLSFFLFGRGDAGTATREGAEREERKV